MDINDIKMVPGFVLHEHTPGYTVLTVPSGYKLKITRLGPHTFRILDTRPDLADPGPLKIKVQLLAQTHPELNLVEEILYVPPTDDAGNPECPDKDKHPKAWAYFQQWRTRASLRQEVARLKDSVRTDMFTLNSIHIVDGPLDIDAIDTWWQNMAHLLPDMTKSTYSERMLLFLQTQVLTTAMTVDVIRMLATVKEVMLEGLKEAFDTFWGSITREESVTNDG